MIGIVLAAVMVLGGCVSIGDNDHPHFSQSLSSEGNTRVVRFDTQLPSGVIDCFVSSPLVCDADECQQAAKRSIRHVERFTLSDTPSFAFAMGDDVGADPFFSYAAFSEFDGFFDGQPSEVDPIYANVGAGINGWRRADILDVEADKELAPNGWRIHRLGSDIPIEAKERAGLLDMDSPLVVHLLSGYPESRQQENRPYPHKPSLNADVFGLLSHEVGLFSSDICHFLRGKIHFLRSRIHSLLGDEIIFLVLMGFGFAALAGIGLGMILDNFNTDRRVGWLLLISGLPLFVMCFLLGMP